MMGEPQVHALHLLAKEGNVKALQQALRSTEPNIGDDDGMTPLHYAGWYGHPLCCQALISAGANLNAHDNDGATALHAAAFNGQLAALMLLVENGGDATITDNDNLTAKDQAFAENQAEVVAYLREVEEDQDAEKELLRLEKMYNDAKERSKAAKASVIKATKEAKRLVTVQDKEAKKVAKQTLRLKKAQMKAKSKTSLESMVAKAGSPEPPPERVNSTSSLGKRANSSSSLGKRSSSHGSTPTPPTSASPSKLAHDVEMLLAQLEADRKPAEVLTALMSHLDMQEFAPLLLDEHYTVDKLRKSSQSDLKKLGLPGTAAKKVIQALHG